MAHLTPLDDASWINIMGDGVPNFLKIVFHNLENDDHPWEDVLRIVIIFKKITPNLITYMNIFLYSIWNMTFLWDLFYIFGYTFKSKYRSLIIFNIIFSLLTIETIFWGQVIALFDLKIWFSQIWRIFVF